MLTQNNILSEAYLRITVKAALRLQSAGQSHQNANAIVVNA
jgi:hypothetical protein